MQRATPTRAAVVVVVVPQQQQGLVVTSLALPLQQQQLLLQAGLVLLPLLLWAGYQEVPCQEDQHHQTA